MIDPTMVFFGLVVGVLVGLTGIGGGSLLTPLLILAGGVPPTVAIGTDLAYGAVTKTVGGWRHLKRGTVDTGVSRWLAFGSLPGSLIGVLTIDHLNDSGKDINNVLLPCIAVALLIVALTILIRTTVAVKAVANEQHTADLSRGKKAWAVSIGAVLGTIVGFTSVGSGALIGLILILFFKLTPHRVVGTDVFHAALLLWVAGIAHFFVGNVDLQLMGTLLIGSIPGVLIGSQLINHVPAQALRTTLSCVLLASALGLFTKAKVEIPPALIIVTPLSAAAISVTVRRKIIRRQLTPNHSAPT